MPPPTKNSEARRQTGRRKADRTDAQSYTLSCLIRQIRFLRTIQKPFEFAFWLLEEQISERQDKLDNRLAFFARSERLLPARARVSLRRLWPESFTNAFEQDGGRA
jgi:hypothetical protein